MQNDRRAQFLKTADLAASLSKCGVFAWGCPPKKPVQSFKSSIEPLCMVGIMPKCTVTFLSFHVFDLMFALDASEEQLDFTTIYGSAKNGWMSTDWQQPKEKKFLILHMINSASCSPRGNLIHDAEGDGMLCDLS